MKPAQRKKTNWKQSLATFFLLAGTVTLTACGGGGSSSDPAAVSTPSADQNPEGIIEEPTPTVEAPATTDASFARVNTEVLQAKCMMCHIDGGLAGGTSLTYANPSSSTHEFINYNVVMNYFDAADGNKEKYLQKAQGGAAHGGGAVLNSSSAEFKLLNEWIDSLETDEEEVTQAPATTHTARGFFEDVQLATPEQTLRRAALVFARRLPTDSELAAVRKGGESALPGLLRGLMKGDGFDLFVANGADEVLLVTAFQKASIENEGLRIIGQTGGSSLLYPEGMKMRWDFGKKYGDRDFEDGPEDWRFEQHGINSLTLQPLELFKYVINNDRSYKEILTADYTMVNNFIGKAYRSDVSGLPPYDVDMFATWDSYNADTSVYQFKPGKDNGRIFHGDHNKEEYCVEKDDGQDICYERYTENIPFISVPHSGVLTMPAFLQRYPSTETNRNRARARWTYKFFLDVDIEKSAARTTDPVALADTNNPTMNNKNCTVCHQRMDPVAGTFQMYDDFGNYIPDGSDALPWTYKKDPDSGFQWGDTWYRDMRTPGFEGMYANKGFDSLPWLGRAIAADPRFPKATVAFWWKAVMGTTPVIAPMEMSDAGYSNQLALFNAQDKAMSELGDKFMRSGFNAKDLFVEMAMSEWFRSATTTDSNAMVAKVNVGARRLLSVEELEAKIEDIVGMEFNGWGNTGALQRTSKPLTSTQRFRIAGGGGDMAGVKDRAEKSTTLIANTAEMAAMRIMCGAVIKDFDTNGKMFRGIDRNTTDPTKLKNKIVELYDRFLGEKLTTTSMDVVDTYTLLTAAAKERRDNDIHWAMDETTSCPWEEHDGWNKYDSHDPKGMIYAWTDVVALLMIDYKFIHE